MISRREVLLGGLALAACRGSARPAPLAISPIGLGTYTLGDDPARRVDELAALRTGLDLGLSHIDTAEMYGDGRSESLVGEAIRGRRHQAFITTKVRPERASYEGTIAACEESLRRLGTDQVDLYLLHNRPTRFSLEETVRAFAELRRRGRVRAVGVSNFETPEQLEEAQRLLGAIPLACDQVKYNLGARHAERALLPACARRAIAVVGYMPFERLPTEGPGRALLDELAAAHGATVHQVVLAFLARDGVRQIPRSGNAAHVRENAAAARLRLSVDAIAKIASQFPS